MSTTDIDGRVATLSWSCGPTAVASALGITRMEAAERILEARRRLPPSKGYRGRSLSTSSIHELAAVVGSKVQNVDRTDTWPTRRTGGGRPTLARWLRENPRAEAILRTSDHFVHVKGGRVVADSLNRTMRRARVTHVVPLNAREG